MATTRDNLTTVLEGGTPERTPLSIYDWNMGAITVGELAARMQEDAWQRLLDQGLGVTAHCEIIEGLERGVETSVEERQENGATLRIVRKQTPEGEIRKVTRNGWHYEDWIKALKVQFLAEQRLLAAAPGRYVKWLENLTIGMIGPRRYRELLMPIYQDGARILDAGGKRVMVHYDGQLAVIADQIAAAPFPIIESVTEPPEGDMTYDACRARWPDKVLWANLNAEVYQQPPDVLRETVAAKRQRAGKRAVAFEISETLPPNWKETVPIVLETLEELAG